jgi:hypothetical protein
MPIQNNFRRNRIANNRFRRGPGYGAGYGRGRYPYARRGCGAYPRPYPRPCPRPYPYPVDDVIVIDDPYDDVIIADPIVGGVIIDDPYDDIYGYGRYGVGGYDNDVIINDNDINIGNGDNDIDVAVYGNEIKNVQTNTLITGQGPCRVVRVNEFANIRKF